MSMHINESDVRIKVKHMNDLLTAIESPYRLKFSFRYNYYVLEEVNANNDLPTAQDRYCAGSKRECYNYICAMLHGIDLHSFKR